MKRFNATTDRSPPGATNYGSARVPPEHDSAKNTASSIITGTESEESAAFPMLGGAFNGLKGTGGVRRRLSIFKKVWICRKKIRRRNKTRNLIQTRTIFLLYARL